MVCFYILDFSEQIRCKDETIQPLVGGRENLILIALPFFYSVADEDDVVSNSHDGVHIVGVDDGGHIVLCGDPVYQLIDDQRGLWVES